ncbi:MAG TPA: rhodanese-like domain-containing protein [Acidimicrobiales bacterium]|nr:rhodanese-like domain-containing protein [Acidimicrobiales bacterium]
MTNAGESMQEVGPEEANELIAGGAFLLDVREPNEWEGGHAAEAHHIPLGELEGRVEEVPKGVTIVCVCRGGGRSARAAAALAGVGHQTINLAGGMRGWHEAGLPMVTDDGTPATVV